MQSTFAPVDWPEDPDHQPRWVMVNGVPDLCCDRHRLYPTAPITTSQQGELILADPG